MNSFTKKIQWTLSALALGVLFSCGSKVPEEPFPQDRNVGGFQVPDFRANTSLPDSLSGWNLTWNPPSSTSGLVQYYIFDDTLTGAMVERLINGSHVLDLAGMPKCQILPISDPSKDTAWEIPTSWLGGKRRDEVSKEQQFRFSIWARYLDGPIGQPVRYDFFLGDGSAPSLPGASEIQDSIGGTRIVLRFPRPRDVTGRFDTIQRGALRSLDFLVWPGRSQFDSAGNVVRWKISAQDLADRTKDTLGIVLDGLRFYTKYVVVMEAVDSVGNLARSAQMLYTTRDSLPPSEVQDLSLSTAGNQLLVSWSAATDTFGPGTVALREQHPNHGIAMYRILLDGKVVDSIDLRGQTEADQSRDTSLHVVARFRWRSSRWTWLWPNLRPGKAYQVAVQVMDVSGNWGGAPKRDSGVAPGIVGITCPRGYVAVKGDTIAGLGSLHDYCIEEHEHARGDTAISRVTWAQAQAMCEASGARLCSEAQWVRACESDPTDSGNIRPYGAIELGANDERDSLSWLKEVCQLGSGDSTRARQVSNADPRCVSAWGVYDLPGRLGEWTLDVFSTTRNSQSWDSGNLAYRGPSDLTGKPDLGVLHGGSALVLQEFAQTLGTAKCRTRNYATSAVLDTLKPQGGTRRRPDPEGSSLGWGFRCCVTF